MIDCNFLIDSVWTKKVCEVELFQSTGRATGGQWFTKLHFNPGFPVVVLGDINLDRAWIQLGHPVYLTADGKAWRPNPERPATSEWLRDKYVDLRLDHREFRTKWQGPKLYLAPVFLRISATTEELSPW